MRPVVIEPAPMPNISGSSNSPLSAADVPRNMQIDRQERDQRDQGGAVAGGKRIAAPDGGLAEQVDRQQRKGRPPLAPYQQTERGNADAQQHQELGSASTLMLLRLLQRQQDGQR